jgi:thymidine phosphorylase
MATEPENVERVTGPFYRWATLSAEEKNELCDAVIVMFEKGGSDSSSVARLTEALVASGERWSWPNSFRPCLDVPSTGGPCSLTTLLCPYLLAGAGFYVPKLGVPGTTAGAIDVLALISSFRKSLDRAAMFEALEKSRVAHSVPNSQLVPADGFLFQFRKYAGKKSLSGLVVASILAKKMAVSCEAGAVDIRCGPSGNMGTTQTECELNAELLARTARSLGLRISAVVTDSKRSSIRFVGRSESLAALDAILTGSATDKSLNDHAELCIQIAGEAALAGRVTDTAATLGSIRGALKNGKADAAFRANLAAQGSGTNQLGEALKAYENTERVPILSGRTGYVNAVGFDRIARALNRVNKEENNDRAGLEVLTGAGESVQRQQPIAMLRVRSPLSEEQIGQLLDECSQSFEISQEPAVSVAQSPILSLVRSWE